MEERLEIFTVQQVRQWLKTGVGERGLSEEVVSRARAWAIIHNPYVKDEDSVVSAIFVNDEIAAYTTAFPEIIEGERYWWISTLWCSPKCEGKGYGLIVIGSLAEIHGLDRIMDRWAAKAGVEVFSYLGHTILYTPRYTLGLKIDRSKTKGRIVGFLRDVQKKMHRLLGRPETKAQYTLRYLPNIDDTTYAFIAAQRKSDYILHSHEFMNWVMQYSFTTSAPLLERIDRIMPFSRSEIHHTQMMAVQVLDEDKIIGFYLLKQNMGVLHILYLYYDEAEKAKVFASIRDHVNRMHIEQCVTEHKPLAEYLRSEIYFPKYREYDISFSIPPTLPQPQPGALQYADGDCFTTTD